MNTFVKRPKDFLCGLLIISIAVLFSFGLPELSIGGPSNLGPGFLPTMLTFLLAAVGAIISLSGLRGAAVSMEKFDWPALALIIGAVVFFGASVRTAGLVPSLVITLLVASQARRGQRWPAVLVATTVVTAAMVLIFRFGLGLPISLFGSF
jgi:lysylphosphatidylglycerol synthetase-like protein (DUF2156 family)